jgi:hypothetical protein
MKKGVSLQFRTQSARWSSLSAVKSDAMVTVCSYPQVACG